MFVWIKLPRFEFLFVANQAILDFEFRRADRWWSCWNRPDARTKGREQEGACWSVCSPVLRAKYLTTVQQGLLLAYLRFRAVSSRTKTINYENWQCIEDIFILECYIARGFLWILWTRSVIILRLFPGLSIGKYYRNYSNIFAGIGIGRKEIFWSDNLLMNDVKGKVVTDQGVEPGFQHGSFC